MSAYVSRGALEERAVAAVDAFAAKARSLAPCWELAPLARSELMLIILEALNAQRLALTIHQLETRFEGAQPFERLACGADMLAYTASQDPRNVTCRNCLRRRRRAP